MKHGNRDGWLLLGIFLIVLVLGYLAAAPAHRDEFKISTTYNPDPKGVKAFYTLLGERLGYTVARLRKPYTGLPTRARMLIVVQPDLWRPHAQFGKAGIAFSGAGITPDERRALTRWVRGGGTVVFLADNLDGVPAAFGSDRRMGNGYVYAFSSRSMITNHGMRDHRNATALLDIIDRHAGKRGLVLFDEYHHGVVEHKSFWSYFGRQVKAAAVILVCAGLVLCHTRGRRFGAVRGMPRSETVRPGYEFVESLARLYRRAHATDVAGQTLRDSFAHALCARLGMPADSPRRDIASRLASESSPGLAERVNKLLQDCEAFEAGPKPTEAELLRVAVEIRELEKELRLGSIGA